MIPRYLVLSLIAWVTLVFIDVSVGLPVFARAGWMIWGILNISLLMRDPRKRSDEDCQSHEQEGRHL